MDSYLAGAAPKEKAAAKSKAAPTAQEAGELGGMWS